MSTTVTRHETGTVVRITGGTKHNLGRLGEIVSDTGVWYRLRIDNSVAVLFRHEDVAVVQPFVVAQALRIELRTQRVDSLAAMLTDARACDHGEETIRGLRQELVAAASELAVAKAAALV